MRNLEAHAAPRSPGSADRPGGAGRERSPADATSVLLELTRALRGLSVGTGSPNRPRVLAERAFQAVSAEIARSGPFELSVRGETFGVNALADRLDARGGLAELRTALVRHAIECVAFDARLTPDALQAFLEQLLRPPAPDRDVRAFLRTLTARDGRGIRLNDLDELADTQPRPLRATPPRPSLSVTTPRVATPEPPAVEPKPAPAADPTAAALSAEPARVEPRSPAPDRADSRGERLRARLVELDHTTDDERYAARTAEIVGWVREVWRDGLRDDAYRALALLADHSVGGGGRAESQARVAANAFAELAAGDRLEDLIDRALVSDASGVRAAQLLLQRRDAAVPLVVDRICALPDPFVATPLHALVLTCGEAAVPTLLRGIAGSDDARARVCLRLAGTLQSPALLATLSNATRCGSLGRQVEAIRALCLLPGEAAHQALADALSSQLDQLAIAATRAIADNSGIDAVPALLDVLESHMRGSRTQLCRALIEVLGRLGDERAVPRLAAILERKPVLRRAHWHALQLAAVDALAALPTREARRAVERAASHAAAPVRDRARARLSATPSGSSDAP